MSWFRSGWRTFQFTPLREGRRDCGKAGYVRWHFNSRPSARGDVCKSQRRERKSISIHAPPRGATFADSANAERLVISIHAPPRGATAGRQAGAYSPDYFNSRPSARGDGKRYAISANLLFNPYKSAWLNNSATQFVEIILVIFHRIIV